MPRNGSGSYSLPAGNPVSSGTLIEASWANTTLSDLASAMTDSLARSGEGGMTGPLRVADGSVSVPSVAFTNETSTGFYRAGATNVRFAMGGVDVATVTTAGVTVGSTKVLALPDGTAAAPSMTNTGDTNTGVYFPAEDTVGVSTGGTERVRVDASGNVGIGTSSPVAKLDVVGNIRSIGGASQTLDIGTTTGVSYIQSYGAATTATPLLFYTGTNERMRLDASGNLGLGVTPSAWSSGFRAIQIAGQGVGLSSSTTASDLYLSSNGFYDGSNWRYVNSSVSGQYRIIGNAHQWLTAPGASAGNAISFTQAMTLDANGNLTFGVNGARIGNRSIVGGDFKVVSDYDPTSTLSLEGASHIKFSTYDTSWTERARFTSGGNLLVGVTSGSRHWLSKDNAASYAVTLNNTNSNPLGAQIYHDTDVNGSGNQFLDCQGGANVRTQIRSNGGIANYSGNNVNLSDRREKTNFAPAKSYLDAICAIPVQTFEYIDQSPDDPGLTLGVVAQDVQAVAPELVMESNWGTAEEPKIRLSIYQTDLQYALMKCIQEQQAIITQLTARIEALEAAA